MRLYVKSLAHDLLEIDWNPLTGPQGIREAIHEVEPSWSLTRLEPFLPREDMVWAELEEDDCIGLLLSKEWYVKIIRYEDTFHFFIHASSNPQFSYPDTHTIMFEHTRHPRADAERFSTGSGKHFLSLYDFVMALDEFDYASRRQIAELAEREWKRHFRNH